MGSTCYSHNLEVVTSAKEDVQISSARLKIGKRCVEPPQPAAPVQRENRDRSEQREGNVRDTAKHQETTAPPTDHRKVWIPLQKDPNIPVHRPKRHRLPPSQQRETQSSYFGPSQQRETQSSYFGSTKGSTKPGATTSEVSRPKAEDNKPKHHPEAIDRPRRGSKPRNFLIPSMEAANK